MRRIFFDTETTGLPKRFGAPATDTAAWDSARLVQISWVLQDEHKELSRSDLIVRPEGFAIPDESFRVHGISTERARTEGVKLEVAVYYFLGCCRMADVIIGHNVPFDLGVVGAEMVRVWGNNYLENVRTEDTMKASTDYCAIPKANGMGYKFPKLMELYRKLFGVEFEGAHDSMQDILATVECYWELKRIGVM